MKQARMAVIGGILVLGIILGVLTGGDSLTSSSISASLESCKNRNITDKALCEPILSAEKNRLNGRIQTIDKNITKKESECQRFAQQNKQPQLRRCRDAVRDMRSDVRSWQQQLKTVESALAGLTQTVSVTLRNCCADIQARNYDAQCGRDGVSQSQLSTCSYPVSVIYTPIVLGCTDITAINYNAAATQDDGTCQNASLLCMDSLATNFLSSLPCTYFQNKSGCTDRMANNYDSTATIDDESCIYDPTCNGEKEHGYDPAARTCMTCSDGVQNGDETDVDCGGKCDECKKACKDPQATNYNPDTKFKADNSLCEYSQNISEPTPYCDVPEAVNYEQHDSTDTAYRADSGVCIFCGNDKTDGMPQSDGTVAPVDFVGEVSGITVQATEQCDEGKDDKPYDGCYQCRIETCGDELTLCQAYKFTGGEKPSSLSSKLSDGLKDNSASKRPEWNNHSVDTVTTRGRDFATFGSICIRDKDKKIVSYTGFRTVFGLNVDGSVDSQDNGWGATDYGNVCKKCNIRNLNLAYAGSAGTIYTGNSGEVPTSNKIVRGVAVPKEMLREIFGTDVNYRRVRVDVKGPNGCFRYPIVDEGPNEYTWTRKCSAILDMTYATAAELGLLEDTAKPTTITWTIAQNAGEDFRERLTPEEINGGFTSMTFGNTYGYKYRQYTEIDYPTEYFTRTPCN